MTFLRQYVGHIMRRRPRMIATIIFLFILPTTFSVNADESRMKELAKLSIEELINIKVTSVLKTPQPWSHTSAAITIITQDDIRRSGAVGIPDLLRTVPGVQVSKIEEDIYAITIRGFNDIHANKLLVMVDGLSVYNHIFSGVIWSHLDLFIEDIDRIEIIRGPGSSVWGANAVNGVINIITRKADKTQGAVVRFSGGSQNTVISGARYGGNLGDTFYRFYVKGVEKCDDYLTQSGLRATGNIHSGMTGLRIDREFNNTDSLSFQGKFVRYMSDINEYNPRLQEQSARSVDQRAGHLQSQWRHTFSENSKTTLQMYYQYEKRKSDYRFDVLDFDFQHDYDLTSRHQVVWGVGYRRINDNLKKGLLGGYVYDPMESDLQLFSFFGQDTVQLVPDTLNMTLGSKFEHNDFTGLEIQPSLRASWMPSHRNAFWAAISRAVRTPSRIESDAMTQMPGIIQTKGDKDFDSEDLTACEVGYRSNLSDNVLLDLALFYNIYDNLATYRKLDKNIWQITNNMEGETYGAEVMIDYRPMEGWRLYGAYSFLKMDMRLKNPLASDLTIYTEETSPRHQFVLYSAFDITEFVEADIWLRYVDKVRNMRPPNRITTTMDTIGDYTQIDARIAWKPTKNVTLSLTGRNLLANHKEFTQHEVEERIFFEMIFKTDVW